MSYRTEKMLRWLAFFWMMFAAVSSSIGSNLGLMVGVTLWALLLPFAMSGFLGRRVSTVIQRLKARGRLQEVIVPRPVVHMTKRFNVQPPKTKVVIEEPTINASVNGTGTLFVTQGLWLHLLTVRVVGIMAHEMAHLSRKHLDQKNWMLCLLAIATLVTVGLIGNVSWSVFAAVSLTLTSLFWPIMCRRQEFDADSCAADVVGVDIMVHSIRGLTEGSEWDEETDSHPSVRARMARLLRRRH